MEKTDLIIYSPAGIAWNDHQWGDFPANTGGWIWYSIQLNNGVQYMLYFIHDQNGDLVQKVGTQVNRDGSTIDLAPSEVSNTGHGNGTSPATGNSYQQSWNVTVPGGSFSITSQLANQEVTSSIIPFPYWEGTSTVTGTLDGNAVSGVAYVEQEPTITFGGPGSIWTSIFQKLTGN